MSTPTDDLSHAPCLLAVDDDPANLQLLRQILQGEFRMLFAKDGLRAIELAQNEQPDLVLLDVMMPGMTGFEACRELKKDTRTAHIPVVFVSALFDNGAENDGFDVGGADYIAKPVNPLTLKARVRAQLALAAMNRPGNAAAGAGATAGIAGSASFATASTAAAPDAPQDDDTSLQASRLGLMAALRYRDEAIANHARRVGAYAQILARAAGMSEDEATQLAQATALHDLGMIGVEDAILHKPEPLDAAERALVRRHPAIGAEIIGADARGVLAVAREVALTHHERWDGAGYPAALEGEMIPLAGRIVAIADNFDALTRAQPWRAAWPLQQALSHLHAESGKAFDPALVRLFLENLGLVLAVLEQDRAPLKPE